jgi:hypothetical protein
MKKIVFLGLAICFLGFLSGCRTMSCPNWLHPGSEDAQLRTAKRYDPFPETNMGPGTTNLRPRGFENPIAEPSQARWELNHWKT